MGPHPILLQFFYPLITTKTNLCVSVCVCYEARQVPFAGRGGGPWRPTTMGRSGRRTGCGGPEQQATALGPNQLRANLRQRERHSRNGRHLC